jgi:hypothetical protein
LSRGDNSEIEFTSTNGVGYLEVSNYVEVGALGTRLGGHGDRNELGGSLVVDGANVDFLADPDRIGVSI